MFVKKKLNKHGFLLVETLIVSVFIMAIFMLLYTNFLPLIAEYDRYKNYDTVEATYISHWARKIALKGLTDAAYQQANNRGYVDVSSCQNSVYWDQNQEVQRFCNSFMVVNEIKQFYLTTYQTVRFKNIYANSDSLGRPFQEYVAYLPTYAKNSRKASYYRVVIEYETTGVKRYGTMEVRR